MRKLLGLFLFVPLVICGTAVAQGTPDGETPANEGVCDELMFATPGLYGLCIAFCEAQDCEPDNSLVDPFQNCKPSSAKLLGKYRSKMQASDPDMPCVRTPCPCWTAEDLEVLGDRLSWELFDCDIQSDPPTIRVLSASVPFTVFSSATVSWSPMGGAFCSYTNFDGLGPGIIRFQSSLDPGTSATCEASFLSYLEFQNVDIETECIP